MQFTFFGFTFFKNFYSYKNNNLRNFMLNDKYFQDILQVGEKQITKAYFSKYYWNRKN